MNNQISNPLFNGFCDKCIYRQAYSEEDEDDSENWYCVATRLIASYVPCNRILQCEDFKQCKDFKVGDVNEIFDLKQMAETARDKMEITDTEVSGFKMAILGMRNPMDSWEFSDSRIEDGAFVFGENDLKLAQNLIIAGSEHSKFMRMIHVQANINMPRYFWSEADTYHFNTKNSCSTMHKLLNNKNKIRKNLFVYCEEDEDILDVIVERLEYLRQMYSETRNNEEKDKLLLRAKRILPEGFLQMRTFDTNYAEIRNMYFQRRNHRLKEEWQQIFCKWVETLPYAKELIMLEKPKEGAN